MDKQFIESMDNVADSIRFAAKHLGKEDASGPMGAIENLSEQIREGSQRIADGLHAIAEAIALKG
jgi:uncharacterized protein Yka (UPF0111/DUF47 family)